MIRLISRIRVSDFRATAGPGPMKVTSIICKFGIPAKAVDTMSILAMSCLKYCSYHLTLFGRVRWVGARPVDVHVDGFRMSGNVDGRCLSNGFANHFSHTCDFELYVPVEVHYSRSLRINLSADAKDGIRKHGLSSEDVSECS